MDEGGPAPDVDGERYEQGIHQDSSMHDDHPKGLDDRHGAENDDSDDAGGHQFGSPETDHRAERRGLSTDALAEELEEAMATVTQLQDRNRQWRGRVLQMKRDGAAKDETIARLEQQVQELQERLALALLADAPTPAHGNDSNDEGRSVGMPTTPIAGLGGMLKPNCCVSSRQETVTVAARSHATIVVDVPERAMLWFRFWLRRPRGWAVAGHTTDIAFSLHKELAVSRRAVGAGSAAAGRASSERPPDVATPTATAMGAKDASEQQQSNGEGVVPGEEVPEKHSADNVSISEGGDDKRLEAVALPWNAFTDMSIITCSALGEESGGMATVGSGTMITAPIRACASEEQPCGGIWGAAAQSCRLVLNWDNSFSRLRRKVLSFEVKVFGCDSAGSVNDDAGDDDNNDELAGNDGRDAGHDASAATDES
eukprot:g1310.t1